jgi:hypothetical protein
MDLFFPVALLGPLLTAIIVTAAGRPWWWAALPYALYFGVWGFIHDTFILDTPEDRVFHIVLTLLIVGLAALGGAIGRRIARRRPQAA